MKPVQYFSDEYIASCRKMTPTQIAHFLDDFRKLHGVKKKQAASVLISLKVPRNLLAEFRGECDRVGIKYQTQIKALMQSWVNRV